MRIRSNEGGFTLIELMIVVAIVAILAALAVTFFGKTQTKVKFQTELRAMMSEFKLKEGQAQLENGTFIATGANEGDTWPASPAGASAAKQVLNPFPATWDQLRFNSEVSAVHCAYVVITGLAGDNTNIGPIAASMGFTVPQTDWFYVLAECDADDSGVVNSFYLEASTHDNRAVLNPEN